MSNQPSRSQCRATVFYGLKIIFFHDCSFLGKRYVITIVRSKDPFEELLHRYRGLLFTLCRRFSRRGMEVDDLLQDATVALWRAREKVLGVEHNVQQAALVWKIARNAVIDTLRRTSETVEIPDGYEEQAEDRSLLTELHEQIALLDEPDRTIVTLQLQGFSYEEIALHLDMTEKNVSVRLVRIKEKLKKKFVKT